MIQVRYFARLREDLGSSGETLEPPQSVRTVGALRAWLAARGEPWANALRADKAVRVAVNQEMAPDTAPVAAGDEVAFFPPVTGG